MRLITIFLTIITALCLYSCPNGIPVEQKIRLMTFNIRLDVASDSLNAWPYRKDKVAGMILFHRADLIGVQEALPGQVDELARRLPDFDWYGLGRDDGKKAGEFMAVFYRKERFSPLEKSTFWLSETPDQPGLGWDAACNRTVTQIHFTDKLTQKEFYLFNTHFDHMGETARLESARLLRREVNQITNEMPVIVCGDFNATPETGIYKILTADQGPETVRLFDSEFISLLPHHGPHGTFTGFDLGCLNKPIPQIDFIFVNEKIKVLSHGTLSDNIDGFFPSDHFPVLAELQIK